jgi:hypothetical protein
MKKMNKKNKIKRKTKKMKRKRMNLIWTKTSKGKPANMMQIKSRMKTIKSRKKRMLMRK